MANQWGQTRLISDFLPGRYYVQYYNTIWYISGLQTITFIP
jgi:hypothetical protein